MIVLKYVFYVVDIYFTNAHDFTAWQKQTGMKLLIILMKRYDIGNSNIHAFPHSINLDFYIGFHIHHGFSNNRSRMMLN